MSEIEIFSGPGCGYCFRAKALLDGRGLTYRDRDVSDPAVRREFVARMPRARTIPQIFIAGQHIGGYDDLALLDRSGRLDELLAAEA